MCLDSRSVQNSLSIWSFAPSSKEEAQFIRGTEGVCEFSKVVKAKNTTEPFQLKNSPIIVGTIITTANLDRPSEMQV